MNIRYLPKPKRFHLQWHITDRCNWQCKHCYQDGKYFNNEVDTEGLFHILDEYIKILKLWGIRGSLYITGGEPFIRKDLFQLLERVHENADTIYKLGLMTNGSFLREETVKKIKKYNIKMVQVSLEGMKDVNDIIRGEGSFEKIINALKILVDAKINTSISFTSHKKNYKDFEKVVELGKNIGVNTVWTDRLVPCGQGRELQRDMLDPHEVKEHYESIHKISKKLIQEGGNTQVPTHRALYFLAADNTMIHRGYVCNAGETLSAVMPNGDVLTCRRLPLVVGNLMKQSFFEIWYGNEILWEMRDRNKINFICRKCEYFEKCMGGARCVTYEYCGDQFAPDPQCWKAFKELPSPEKLKSYKPENSKEFSPIHKEIYSIGSEVKPYIQLRENSILYVSEQVKSLSENQFWEINLMNLQSEAEKIIDQRSDFIIIFFKFSEDDLNKKSVEILNFLLKLIDNGINFKVANPIPRCLFDFRYLDITQKFNIPKSCKNCLKLFKIDENDEIKLCIGKKLPKLKYMSNRDQIYEYFRFFNKNLDENNKCKSCLWFIRNKCNGLCKSIEDTI